MLSLPIRSPIDVVRARQAAAALAEQLGFVATQRHTISTAVSEICRNVVQHAGQHGQLDVYATKRELRVGMLIRIRDRGRGAPEGRTSATSAADVRRLGAGLQRCRTTMDVFRVDSVIGEGTLVQMIKWV